MNDNQNLMAGAAAFHENDQGHMVSSSGEYLALIRHRAITFEVLSSRVLGGKMHMVVYHTFMAPVAESEVVKTVEPDETKSDETKSDEPRPRSGKKNDS